MTNTASQSNTDEFFMYEALKEAAKARDAGNWAIGCVVTLEGKIVARAYNQVYSSRSRLAHAEITAIAQLQEQYFEDRDKDFTIYTTLEPCPMCFGAMLSGYIHRVVAGANFDNSGASAYLGHLPEFFRQDQFKTTFTTGVLAMDCANMWLSSKPAQRYIEKGVVIPAKIRELTNSDIVTYVTPTLKEVD
jgi:tRNA(adenine34) deaminase